MSEGKVRLGNVRPVTGGRRAELRPELRPSCEAIRLRHPPPEPGHGSAWAVQGALKGSGLIMFCGKVLHSMLIQLD